MLASMMILSLVASSVHAAWPYRNSAATDAQIRFAIENKYDSTGPGAKTPEYAYKTYQNLDEALVAFANDPDTQLPEYEKNLVLQKLTNPYNEVTGTPIQRFKPKTVDEYTGYKPPNDQNALYGPQNRYRFGVNDIGLVGNERPTNSERFKYQKFYLVKESPLSLSHYSKPVPPVQYPKYKAQEEFNDNPQYSFSYGVHDKGTGDSKSAHETRDGGTVRGFYTFVDADGKQRTVHYTADDKLGFRATVQRSHTNAQ